MREIVWDTETTGIDPKNGHRLIEIGAVELQNHLPTGQEYHQYINPERDMPEEAFAIHGLSADFLRDYPVFSDIVQDFLAFIGDSVLIAHNVNFDMKFLNAELSGVGLPPISDSRTLDTLELARNKFPGMQNSLDALARRFNVDSSSREKHGALIDSHILAQVYLELLGGRQTGLAFDTHSATGNDKGQSQQRTAVKQREKPLAPRITAQERDAHRNFLTKFKKPVWHRYSQS